MRRWVVVQVYRVVCVDVWDFAIGIGRLAQMVERPLRMREVGGSIPPMSNSFPHTHKHLPPCTLLRAPPLTARSSSFYASFFCHLQNTHRTVQRMACHYVIVPTYKYPETGWISLGTIKTNIDAKPNTK